jgi:hypothetical protein
MEFEGWSNTAAMDEMRSCGYVTLDEDWDILNYMESYRPGRLVKISAAPK